MTHGKLWPAHPRPFKDELLSSWIVRIAQANGIKLQTLSRMLFGENLSPWMRDIDRTPPEWLLDSLCKYTGVDKGTLLHATLETFKDCLHTKNRVSGHQKWVLTLSQMGTMRRGYGQQYCPTCLAEDPNPYFRKEWRIALLTYCPKHRIELYDACPRCGMPVVYYRVDFGRDAKEGLPIFACYNCGYDLRDSNRVSVNFPTIELRDVYDAVLHFLSSENNRDCEINGQILDVTHQLCKVMGSRSNGGKLLGYILKQICLPKASKPTGRVTIEERRRSDRYVWILSALWLVSDFENRIHDAWNNHAVVYNSLLKDFSEAPGWYLDAVGVLSNWRSRTQ